MMEDWANDDAKLLGWRKETGETAFEKTKTPTRKLRSRNISITES